MCHFGTKSVRPSIAPSSEPQWGLTLKELFHPYFDHLTKRGRSARRKLSIPSTSHTPATRLETMEHHQYTYWQVWMHLPSVPANSLYCDCYLTGTWSGWSWTWLVSITSPLPLVTTNNRWASYNASRMTSHHLQKVCICWWSNNHACQWRLASSGRSAQQRHGNCRWTPPDLEAEY